MKKSSLLIGSLFSLWLCSNWLCIDTAWSQSSRSQRPRPPANFDAATVQQLIEQADQRNNAEWLKILYFSRRPTKPGELPVEAGWKLLEEELAKEKPATLKWFYLQNVRGVSALNLPFVSPSEGIKAYGAMFDAAKQATPEESEYVVRNGINEFVSLLRGRIEQLNLAKTPETREVVRKALRAYFVSSAYTNSFARRVPKPDWLGTFDEIETNPEFKGFVEVELKNNPQPLFEFLLISSAALLETGDYYCRQYALTLLEQAKPLIPKLADGRIDPVEAETYYKVSIRVYGSLNKGKEQVQAAKEQFELLKKGRAELVEVLLDKNDSKSLAPLLTDLHSPTANEKEILAVSQVLYRYSISDSADVNANERRVFNEALADKLVLLLTDYLTTKRQRKTDAELEIRLRLGRVFYAKAEYVKAQKVIDEAKPLLVGASANSEAGLALGRLAQRIQEAQKLATLPVKG